jgi:hypothetical protein
MRLHLIHDPYIAYYLWPNPRLILYWWALSQNKGDWFYQLRNYQAICSFEFALQCTSTYGAFEVERHISLHHGWKPCALLVFPTVEQYGMLRLRFVMCLDSSINETTSHPWSIYSLLFMAQSKIDTLSMSIKSEQGWLILSSEEPSGNLLLWICFSMHQHIWGFWSRRHISPHHEWKSCALLDFFPTVEQWGILSIIEEPLGDLFLWVRA